MDPFSTPEQGASESPAPSAAEKTTEVGAAGVGGITGRWRRSLPRWLEGGLLVLLIFWVLWAAIIGLGAYYGLDLGDSSRFCEQAMSGNSAVLLLASAYWILRFPIEFWSVVSYALISLSPLLMGMLIYSRRRWQRILGWVLLVLFVGLFILYVISMGMGFAVGCQW